MVEWFGAVAVGYKCRWQEAAGEMDRIAESHT